MRNPRNDTLGSPTTEGPDTRDNASERRCVLTGQTGERDALLRLAVSPDGDVLPDAMAKAPGRGAWIGVSRDVLAAAIADGSLRRALARAFKSGALSIPDDLPARMESALRRALTERLGLELRSGRLILGSDRIANEARMGKVAALYHASDARPDGSAKLDQAWRVGLDQEGTGIVGETLPLDRTALSVALGRDNVVHLALADRASARRVLVPLQRLQTFLNAGGDTGESGYARGGDAAGEAAGSV